MALTGLCTGCADSPQPQLYPVRGRITLDGQPLPRGSVSLRSLTPGVWDQPTGVIEPPGQYTIYTNRRAGAPPGSYRVVVFATESAAKAPGGLHPEIPKSLLPNQYNHPEQSPLRLEVVAKPSPQAYDLQLQENPKSETRNPK